MTRRTAIALLAPAAVSLAAGGGVCRQLLTVESRDWSSTRGTLRLWTRESEGAAWRMDGAAIPVVLGRKGMRWGRGLHAVPRGAVMKAEGDGCSPAGLFILGTAFGPVTAGQAALPAWPWLQVTPHHAGVDDVKSGFYNRIVDARRVKKDWGSAENMVPASGAYRWAAVVNHNAACTPGGGSCIFLHVWTGPRGTTSGCTAMAEADMVRVLRWLDQAKYPRLAQWPRTAWPAACAGIAMPRAENGQ